MEFCEDGHAQIAFDDYNHCPACELLERVAELEADIEDVEESEAEDVAQLEERIADLESEVEALEQEVERLEGELEEAQA